MGRLLTRSFPKHYNFPIHKKIGLPFQPHDKSGENYTFVPMKPHHLILFLLVSALAACHTSTHDVEQVAFDALENARIQLDSGNKAEAMKLFKEAEHYGSRTVSYCPMFRLLC